MRTIKYKDDSGTEARVAGLLKKLTSKGKNKHKVQFCHLCPCYMMQLHRSKGVTILELALL